MVNFSEDFIITWKEREAKSRLEQTPWDQITTEQKLERLREQVKALQHEVELVLRRFNMATDLVLMLDSHTHAPDGSVMVPIRAGRSGTSSPTSATKRQVERVKGYF